MRNKIKIVVLIVILIIGFFFVSKMNFLNSPYNGNESESNKISNINMNTDTDIQDDTQKNISIEENATDKTYYLHKSNFKIPNREKCYSAQTYAFEGLTYDEEHSLSTGIHTCHTNMENLLLNYVSTLKDVNSPYWIPATESGIHEEPEHPDTIVESDGGFSKVLDEMTALSSTIENLDVKKDLEQSCLLLQEGIDNHEISKLFEAHEIIHDYDYWVFNPYVTLKFEPDDWEGVNIYFGTVSIIK